MKFQVVTRLHNLVTSKEANGSWNIPRGEEAQGRIERSRVENHKRWSYIIQADRGRLLDPFGQ